MLRRIGPAALVVLALAAAPAHAVEPERCTLTPGDDCPHAKLFKRQLVEADLTRSNLREAWLVEARLTRVTLNRANLVGADFTRARITRGSMRGLNPGLHVGSGMRFIRARLSGVKVDGNLQGATFAGATLAKVDFSGARLSRADFRAANLRGADLRDTNLTGANLSGADLSGADLRGANLTNANFDHAKLRLAKLDGARLVGTKLRMARAQGADLDDAVIAGADFTLAKLTRAPLGFYAAPMASLGDPWLDAAGRFPLVLDLAARVCRTQISAPVTAAARPASQERGLLSPALEKAHEAFRAKRAKALAAPPAGRTFATAVNADMSGCGSGAAAAATALDDVVGPLTGRRAAIAARVGELLAEATGIDAPAHTLSAWLDAIVRSSR